MDERWRWAVGVGGVAVVSVAAVGWIGHCRDRDSAHPGRADTIAPAVPSRYADPAVLFSSWIPDAAGCELWA
jgi:hypothetical protein